ncbi:MAG: DUF2812 domain-containing protein [Bacillota bacterium]|nr:DUF2812 domain-containing protein [Bacillota bacterium]
MKDTKCELVLYSPYEYTAIEKHLEKMAAEGWLIQKIGFGGWTYVYRRISPAKLHFTVSCYPQGAAFDMEIVSEEQKVFHEFCRRSGWQLACASSKVQIFYNEEENPTPIETDPRLKVDSIHRALKKSYLPSYWIIFFLFIFCGLALHPDLLRDPAALLSSPRELWRNFLLAIVLLYFPVELCRYYLWRFKAKKAAECGEFSDSLHPSAFPKMIVCLGLLGMIYKSAMVYLPEDAQLRWTILLMIAYLSVLALFILASAVRRYLRYRKAKQAGPF